MGVSLKGTKSIIVSLHVFHRVPRSLKFEKAGLVTKFRI